MLPAPEGDSAREILELLELELGAMIRQLERAANSVAGGAEATAATLSTIRQRTDALTGRTSAAQSTATTFSLAADKFTHSAQGIGSQVRDASKLADEASAAAREASLNVDRLQGILGGDRQCRQPDRADRPGRPRCWRSTPPSRRRGPVPPDAASRWSPPRSRRWRCRPRTRPRKSSKKIDALQRDAAGSVDAVHRISQAIEAIRPVFEIVNGAVAEQTETTSEISDNAATASNFIVSVGESAAEIDTVTKQAEAHGESVASAGKAVTMFAQKLKSRCAVLLRQDERKDQHKSQPLPCNLAMEIQTARGLIAAPAYEISIDGILIGGADAEKLPLNETLNATLHGIGACRIRIRERSKAGAQARFEAADAALKEKIEDKLWSIQDENTESVTRAMEAGRALTRIFEDAVRSGAISMDDMFDENYVEIAGTNPVQYRTRVLDWADRALPPFQEAFLAKDPRMAFCAMIDRNGYLPVHNKIYSHPQRAGRRRLEHRQQPQPPHLQRSRGPCRRPQPARLSDPELRPRHGQRPDHHDARDRRADPRQRPPLGRIPHGVQAVTQSLSAGFPAVQSPCIPAAASPSPPAGPAWHPTPALHCHQP